MRSAAVVGIGNILRADDGVGVRVIEALERSGFGQDADLYDGGTSPLDMLGVFVDHEVVVIVDCVRAGGRPGTLYRLTPEELGSTESSARFAHGVGVVEALGLARELGSRASVVLVGVEPEHTGWSLELSPSVEASVAAVVDLVRGEIERVAERPVA